MNKKVNVYIDINPLTNEPFYVGIGCKGRISDKHRNKIHTEIRKGFPDMEFERRIIHEDIDLEEAYKIEKHLIDKYGRIVNKTGILANIHPGGPLPQTDPYCEHWLRGRTYKEVYGPDWKSPRAGKSYDEQYGDRKDDIIRRQTKFRQQTIKKRKETTGLTEKEKQKGKKLAERHKQYLTEAEKKAYKKISALQKGKTMKERLNNPDYIDPRKGKQMSEEEKDRRSVYNYVPFFVNDIRYENQKDFLDKTGFRYGYLSRLRQLGQITLLKDHGIFKKYTVLTYREDIKY